MGPGLGWGGVGWNGVGLGWGWGGVGWVGMGWGGVTSSPSDCTSIAGTGKGSRAAESIRGARFWLRAEKEAMSITKRGIRMPRAAAERSSGALPKF